MTQSRIGFNINGQAPGDIQTLLDWHRINKPTWALVMDGMGLAAQIKNESPTTNVIIRAYPDTGNEDTYKLLSPEGFIARAIEQQAHRDLWVQVGNESGFSDELLNWTARVIELAAVYNQTASQPLKLVVLNHAVGTPQPNDWKRAVAVKVLMLASKYREWCVIGLHEYFNIVPTSGFRGGYPTWIQPEDWPENPYTVGALWHCGRFQFALEACRENGITPYPRMVLTEHGTDDVSDIKQWVESFGQGSGRGWKHAAKLWALPSFYPGKPKENIFAGMLKYLDERLYRNSPVEGQLIFTLSKSPDWAAFDAAEMLGHIKSEDAPPPAPLPDPPPVVVDVPAHPGLPTTLTNTFQLSIVVRNKPAGKNIGGIIPGAKYTYYPNTTTQADGFTWYYVEYGVTNGWSREDAMGLVDDKPQEPPEPPPDEPSTDLERILLEFEILRARVTALESRNEALENIVAGAGHILVSVNGKES